MNDRDRDPLSDLLRTWRHEPPDEPQFNQSVWARIAAKPAKSSVFEPVNIIARVFGLPAQHFRWALPLAASIAVVLSAAVGSGIAVAYESLTRDQQMANVYARSIDPLKMMGLDER